MCTYRVHCRQQKIEKSAVEESCTESDNTPHTIHAKSENSRLIQWASDQLWSP